uniref:Uncharacterized protein n=1 Tax=viral metagenome TaxID=1070528 RepID=A0A6C0AE64_9ZZZZ
MEINISDIPDFLIDSEFYKNLDLNSDEIINIPKLKMDDEVNNIKDFKRLLKTLNFFNVSRFPKKFIKYYQNNSQEVFESLDYDIYKELLIDLCNLKIKNSEQFFVTYKIISLYELNPEDYDNYINYAVNNANELYDEENYSIDEEEYEDLIDKLYSTKILKLKPYEIKNNSIHLKVKIKFLSEKEKNLKTILEIDSIFKIIDAIKNNYSSDDVFYKLGIATYNGNQLFLMLLRGEDWLSPETIKINEFNKKIILEEFEKVIKWIDSMGN